MFIISMSVKSTIADSILYLGNSFILNYNIDNATKFSSADEAVNFIESEFGFIKGICLAKGYELKSLTVQEIKYIPVLEIDSNKVVNNLKEETHK